MSVVKQKEEERGLYPVLRKCTKPSYKSYYILLINMNTTGNRQRVYNTGFT